MMTTATQPREPEMGLTFEKVWAMFQESDRRMQRLSEETDQKIREVNEETDRRIREANEETTRHIKETDQKMREVNEETTRQIREVNEETARHLKETDRQMKETNIHMGGLDHRFGELAEHLVAPNIAEKFNALGFHFNYMSAKLREIFLDKNKQRSAEFDILLENKESVIGVEVKSKPSKDDVKDHVRRLEKLRRYKDGIGDKRKIYGALAGAIMLDDVKTDILKAGLYVITQAGDTVKIDIPEGFTPKAW